MANLSYLILLATTLASVRYVDAHDNGMDMSMDGAMSLASGNMLPYLHFTLGDVVWFQGWVPQNGGAVFGTCVGLFLLAVIERWVAACRSLMEVHWRKHSEIILANKINSLRTLPQYNDTSSSRPSSSEGTNEKETDGPVRTKAAKHNMAQMSMPFIPSFDIPRAVLQMAQAALEFAFMLVVMTYQVSYIISIIVGLGFGEMLFGRYHAHAHL